MGNEKSTREQLLYPTMSQDIKWFKSMYHLNTNKTPIVNGHKSELQLGTGKSSAM